MRHVYLQYKRGRSKQREKTREVTRTKCKCKYRKHAPENTSRVVYARARLPTCSSSFDERVVIYGDTLTDCLSKFSVTFKGIQNRREYFNNRSTSRKQENINLTILNSIYRPSWLDFNYIFDYIVPSCTKKSSIIVSIPNKEMEIQAKQKPRTETKALIVL